jgi:Putative prokaryotic signal transducing protein
MSDVTPPLRSNMVGGIIHLNSAISSGKQHHRDRRVLRFCIKPIGGTMPEAANDHEELVKVFDTDEESEAMVVRGLLESAGISAMTQNREAPQDILPGVGGVVVLVRPDQAEEARQTIEAYRQNPTTDADEAVSEGPAGP